MLLIMWAFDAGWDSMSELWIVWSILAVNSNWSSMPWNFWRSFCWSVQNFHHHMLKCSELRCWQDVSAGVDVGTHIVICLWGPRVKVPLILSLQSLLSPMFDVHVRGFFSLSLESSRRSHITFSLTVRWYYWWCLGGTTFAHHSFKSGRCCS